MTKYYIIIPILGFFILLDRMLLGKYAIHKTHDGFDSYIPYMNQIIDKIYSLELPGWNPDYIGGLPYNLMDINWLSLPVLIGGLLPFPLRMLLIEYIQVMIAGLGMYHFLEYNYKLKYNTKIIGAIFWGYFLVNMTYWRIQDLAVIPLFLVSTQKIINDSEDYKWYWGLFICALDFSFAKGAPFIGLFHAVYLLMTVQYKTFKIIKLLTLFWSFVILLNMPVIATLIFNNDLGSRSLMMSYGTPHEISDMAEFIQRGYQFILFPFINVGNNYGIIVLALFIFSLLNIKTWHNNNKKLFAYFILICFFIHYIDRSNWFIDLRQMMPLATFRLVRLILVAPFILLVISLCNFEEFIKFINSNIKTSVSILFLLTTALSYWHYYKHPFPSNYFEIIVELFTFTFVAFIMLKFSKKGFEVFTVFLGLIIIITYFLNIHFIRIADIHPPSYKHFFESDVFDEIRPTTKSDYRIAFINWHPTIGIENSFQVAGGYASQYLKNYALFWRKLVIAENEEFNNYNYKAYLIDNDVKYESSPPKKIQQLKINMNLLAMNNVRYILSLNEIVNYEKYGLKLIVEGIPFVRKRGFDRFTQIMFRIGENIPYYVYEIVNYFPRFKVTKKSVVLSDDKELYKLLESLDLKQLNESIYYSYEMLNEKQKSIIERYQSSRINSDRKYFISDVKYDDDSIKFVVETDGPIQLLVNENYMRDWEIYINGHKNVILPAYNTLRSIIVGKGTNNIQMVYQPNYLLISYLLSGGVFLISIIMLLILTIKLRTRIKSFQANFYQA